MYDDAAENVGKREGGGVCSGLFKALPRCMLRGCGLGLAGCLGRPVWPFGWIRPVVFGIVRAWQYAHLLVGGVAASAAMAAFPRRFERARRSLFFCLPLAASFGTMAFAVAPQQAFFQPEVVALLGIVVAGAGYTWFTCLF